MRRLITALLAALLGVAGLSLPARAAAPQHRVSYDNYSVMVDGQRVLLQGAEFHYFRLPSPDLWRDVLEKYRAAGFNTVSLYFDWAYHSPKRGVYDFTGVRDVDRLLRTAEELGLWVIARPGPYINAETTGGGFPAWLKRVPGRARSSAPGYTAAYREWLDHINPILARHQVTRGGRVLLYNVENEYQANTDAQYMQDLQDRARADGIDVPMVTNVCCDAASWASTWGSGPGAVQIPGVDDYPQSFECQDAGTVWGAWGEGVTERVRADAPAYAAEYQGGAIDANNAGYDKCRELTGPAYMKYFQKNNLIESGATAFSYYMGFGGTNWGWLGQPNDVYTSYDYGAAITEARQLTSKYDEFKRQSYALHALTPLTRTDAATGPASSNPLLRTAARVNPDAGTQFVLLRHTDRAALSDDAGTLDWSTPDGRYTVPVRLLGRDAKLLVAGWDMGGQRLVYSTSEVLTHEAIGGRDIAVLYGTDGTAGQTVLRYASRPRVTVLDGAARASWSGHDLRLDYTHRGLTRVLVQGGGRTPLLLLLGTDATAAAFWRADTAAGPVLVRGSDLLRSASVIGSAVSLRADSAARAPIEIWAAPGRTPPTTTDRAAQATTDQTLEATADRAPQATADRTTADRTTADRTTAERVPQATAGQDGAILQTSLLGWLSGVSRVTVNGEPLATRPTASGSVSGMLPGPEKVELPELTGWRQRIEAPEARPRFDDSSWRVADAGLASDDYGFHSGAVWYRGHFTATGSETSVDTNAITGRRGTYLVWLNGRFLGSAAGGVQADSEAPVNPDPGPGHFAVPAGLLTAGERAVVSVMVQNMGNNDDWTADDNRFRQPRGLTRASIAGGTGPITWRIQGARGGEDLTDPMRGPLNNGGLYGERNGWHLPEYRDSGWTRASAQVAPGVTWFRTTFRLDLAPGQDSSVLLRFAGAPPAGQRTQLFLNGWNLGNYGAGIGPQTEFVLPRGLLDEHGRNTLALAVVADRAGQVNPVSLVTAGTQRGGVPVGRVPSR
ncbi:beta-galactosidase [Actinoplanes sp. N902-109]|uniref:beta-galactosidase n=1 Tax=Actinoplanes sp. (strain N902-109) TaxID=649831 RepID=UPI0003296885|nr:beta-galactosidase [Actinoplanes sp. N902-109]AGL17620.1 beta-galactosidase [Actinoplanes sp. N902-109]